MSLATPRKIQELQSKLYSKAKQEPNYRFYSLYDKIYRADILAHAYALVKANHGAPGVDEQSFEEIECGGRAEWLQSLQEVLCNRTYQPQPVRRVMIPKPNGDLRPLGIPTIRDRVAQTAVKLLLDPIFEADLEPNAYAYRSGRSPQQAVQAVHDLLVEGYTDVVDADLSKFFDTIPHSELLQSVARRIADGGVLHLLKMWLKSPVQERDEQGNRTLTGGQSKGTPQGGVISPVLANLYMNRFLKHWRRQGKGEQYRACIVNYADDFVILSRGKAAEARAWTQAVLARIGLTLNEQKTCIRDARRESFDFLGYSFGPRYWWKTRKWYMGAWPSKKAIQKLKNGVYELLRPCEIRGWEEVRQDLNAKLRGWQAYFSYGSLAKAYRIVDCYVYNCVRQFLRRRHKATNSRGTRQFSAAVVSGQLGVRRLQTT